MVTHIRAGEQQPHTYTVYISLTHTHTHTSKILTAGPLESPRSQLLLGEWDTAAVAASVGAFVAIDVVVSLSTASAGDPAADVVAADVVVVDFCIINDGVDAF